MTYDELKKEAQKHGYRLTKPPCYQCTCYAPYPNESHKHKNGKWKCIDKFEPIKFKHKGIAYPITRCRRKGGNNET